MKAHVEKIKKHILSKIGKRETIVDYPDVNIEYIHP